VRPIHCIAEPGAASRPPAACIKDRFPFPVKTNSTSPCAQHGNGILLKTDSERKESTRRRDFQPLGISVKSTMAVAQPASMKNAAAGMLKVLPGKASGFVPLPTIP